MAINVGQIASDIVGAVSKVGGAQWNNGVAFAEHGAQSLAALTASTAGAIVGGHLDQQGVDSMKNMLVEQTHQFALTLSNLVFAAIAALFNAAIGAIWNAMRGIVAGTPFAGMLPAAPQL